MEYNCIVTIIVIVAVVVILIINFDKTGLCDYRSRSGSQILNALKVLDAKLFPAKRRYSRENISSYLKNEGFSQNQIDRFYSFLCETDFSVPRICGLSDYEINLLKNIKGVACPLWACKTCCSETDIDISDDDFLLNSHHPSECAIAAKERGYRGFAVLLQGGSNTVSCYGTNNVENCDPPINGCPSASCGLPNGCFGRSPSEGQGCIGVGGYNRTGKTQNPNNYSVYCTGSTQEELDECMNA